MNAVMPLAASLTIDRGEAPLIWLTLFIIAFAGIAALVQVYREHVSQSERRRRASLHLRMGLGGLLVLYGTVAMVVRIGNIQRGWFSSEGLEDPWIWPLLIMAGGWILYATYAEILQRSERRLTWGLLLLRAAGLLALLVALMKPTWTYSHAMVDPGRLAVVLDNSLSMSLADPSGKTRYALARETVDRLKRTLEVAGPRPRLAVEVFDINGEPLTDIPEQPTLERTDLTKAITETTARLRSKTLAGVVVISDGMDNTGRQDLNQFAGLPTPIFTVGFRADTDASSLDLAVKKVRAPERAMINNEIKVEVLVSKTGTAATDALLTIRRGREPFATQKVKFGQGTSEQLVSVNLTPTQPGNFVFTAAIEGVSGERVLANNAQHFPLHVDKEPIRVLYIEGFLRYEYKFLKNRLEDDPDISLAAVVRRTNPENNPPKLHQELITPERLKNLDVVILGDIEASFFTGAEYQALIRWLEEKGHALLLLGGYRSFGPEGFRATPLAEVLPVVFADKPPYQSEEPFLLQLSEDGQRHPVFELSSDRVRDAATWAGAPALTGMNIVSRVKPGASVLAVNPNLTVEGKPAVVVTTQRYGAGQTMVLTADTTWRWSRFTRLRGQADTLYARFWSQTIRWLAGRSLDDQRPLMVVSTDRPDYDVGKPVEVRAVRHPRPDTDLSAAEINVDIAGATGKTVPVQLRASSAEPDVFKGTFYPPVGGRYEVSANLMSGGKPIANQMSEFLVHGSDLELADPGTNRALLQKLANDTGGIYVDVEDAGKLADQIPRKERRVTRVQRSELWDSPFLFGFFLAAVSIEWFLRRRNHLV